MPQGFGRDEKSLLGDFLAFRPPQNLETKIWADLLSVFQAVS